MEVKMGGAYGMYWRENMRAEIWWGNLKERDPVKDIRVNV
jgi:hypothetical protein